MTTQSKPTKGCCKKCKGEFVPKYNGWRCYDPNCPCHKPKGEQELCGKMILTPHYYNGHSGEEHRKRCIV